MIKKIKDLTLEEMHKICKNHICEACPLSLGFGSKLCMRQLKCASETEVWFK